MFIIDSYFVAVLFCIVTMICWGSWGNTQKLAGKTWRYELFYWDYTIGILLFSIIMACTLGSFGDAGRSFFDDLQQADSKMLISAVIGGVIFNASNILLSASVSIAGLSVAFPLGVGLALVLGVFINYFSTPKGDPVWLFIGVLLIVVAIVLNGLAASKKEDKSSDKSNAKRGIVLAAVAGILMSFFYRFVAAAMDLENFESPTPGMITPYTAFFVFAIGIFLSNFIFNTALMKKPFVGEPVTYKAYFKGSFSTHMVGVFGGCVWALGTLFSYIAAGKAGAAISYALGQGAPMIAALWGIFVWKEFKGSNKQINLLLSLMFVFFIFGLGLIIVSGSN
ncbi:multidrug DMT transporter permease [Dysgonomonas sp. Marseille-P4677]|uniref:GRP family sugar transporter n=1 Tax=Dysgonomonas sp. Marseille-P4677 TaxID=2364790 RepID=UPI001913B99D|nr:GRP family sugar transporter [Dysgonomonas sp. Marseille-P4677]MBK5720658.1 multidrug DMT transporter permease [Dysgonomonas sp. Marseille-P4677]